MHQTSNIKYYALCKKIKHIDINPPSYHISKLQPLYEDLAQCFSEQNIGQRAFTKPIIGFKDGASFDYIPDEIKTHIPSLNHRVQYTFKTAGGQRAERLQQLNPKVTLSPEDFGRNMKLCIASSSDQENSEIMYLVYSWFCFLEKHVRSICSKTLTIYLYLTNCTKKLPDDASIELNQIHVNTGFTRSCDENNEIYIFRHEEWFKVLLHESIHAMGVDFSWYNNHAPIESVLQKEFTGVRIAAWNISECYTEIWAEIMNVLIQVYLITKKTNFSSVKHIVYNALYYESCWSHIQCSKILKYYGITYQELTANTVVYQETKTSVFSYYVLKCLLMCNIGLFIEWCEKHRTGSEHNISDLFSHIFDDEKVIEKNMIYFGNFLVQLSRDDRHSQQLNVIQHMKIDIGDSLRMSLWSEG